MGANMHGTNLSILFSVYQRDSLGEEAVFVAADSLSFCK